jgi:hypothetical protein
MNISKEKFNTDLPSNMEPFAFIEQVTTVKTKWAGELSIVSFGALDYNNHYSPEFGGVALLHDDPDLFLAVRYYPWSAENRSKEHERSVQFLKDNYEIAPNDIIDTFYVKFGYSLPAKQERKRREYLEKVRREKNGLPAIEPKAIESEKEEEEPTTEYLDGEQII